MSDFSILHKKYHSVSNLTNDLNNAVIILKRREVASTQEHAKKHPELSVTDDEVSNAKQLIANILSLLDQFYDDQDTRNELYELMDSALFKNMVLKNTDFRHTVTDILKKLKSDKHLSIKDLSGIDKFISILDNEAAVLFRKLRTNRG